MAALAGKSSSFFSELKLSKLDTTLHGTLKKIKGNFFQLFVTFLVI
jgi:hypothetical protein